MSHSPCPRSLPEPSNFSLRDSRSLPPFLAIGFVNGAMMAQMMGYARVDYPYWYGDLYVGGSAGFNGDPDLAAFSMHEK